MPSPVKSMHLRQSWTLSGLFVISALLFIVPVWASGKTVPANISVTGRNAWKYPEDRYRVCVENGSSLDVTWDFPNNVSSQNFSVEIQTRNSSPLLPYYYVTTLNTHEARLLLPEVAGIDYQNAKIQCLIGNGNRSQHIQLFIGEKPASLTITEVTMENWEKLCIKWTKGDQRKRSRCSKSSMKPKTYFNFTFMDEEDVNPIGVNTKCTECSKCTDVSRFNFTDKSYFNITVNSTNEFGSVSSRPVLRYVIDINKPRAPTNFSVTDRGHSWLVVEWCTSSPGQQLQYEITAQRADGAGKDPQETVTTSEARMSHNLTGLLVGQNFTLNLRARSPGGPLHSETIITTSSTLEAVPAGLPGVTVGGFTVSLHKNNDSYRNVHLFWKEIRPELQNGHIMGYKVVNNDKDWHVKGLTATIHNLDSDRIYRFTVNGRTRIGYSTLKPDHSIVLLPRSQMPSVPKNVTVIQNGINSVSVYWGGPSDKGGHAIHYTGYVCKDNCQSGIEWFKDLTSPWVHSLMGNVSQYRVGVSADREDGSSGIVFAECIYSEYGRYERAKLHIRSVAPSDVKFDLVESVCGRGTDVGYTHAYHVRYCISDSNGCLGDFHEMNIARSGSRTSVTLTGLTPGTKYSLSVCGMTSHDCDITDSHVTITEQFTTEKREVSFIQRHMPLIIVLAVLAFGGAICAIWKMKTRIDKCINRLGVKIDSPSTVQVPSNGSICLNTIIEHTVRIYSNTFDDTPQAQDNVNGHFNRALPAIPGNRPIVASKAEPSGIKIDSFASKHSQPPKIHSEPSRMGPQGHRVEASTRMDSTGPIGNFNSPGHRITPHSNEVPKKASGRKKEAAGSFLLIQKNQGLTPKKTGGRKKEAEDFILLPQETQGHTICPEEPGPSPEPQNQNKENLYRSGFLIEDTMSFDPAGPQLHSSGTTTCTSDSGESLLSSQTSDCNGDYAPTQVCSSQTVGAVRDPGDGMSAKSSTDEVGTAQFSDTGDDSSSAGYACAKLELCPSSSASQDVPVLPASLLKTPELLEQKGDTHSATEVTPLILPPSLWPGPQNL